MAYRRRKVPHAALSPLLRPAPHQSVLRQRRNRSVYSLLEGDGSLIVFSRGVRHVVQDSRKAVLGCLPVLSVAPKMVEATQPDSAANSNSPTRAEASF